MSIIHLAYSYLEYCLCFASDFFFFKTTLYVEIGNKKCIFILESVSGQVLCFTKEMGNIFWWLSHLRRKITNIINKGPDNFFMNRIHRIMETEDPWIAPLTCYIYFISVFSLFLSSSSLPLQYILYHGFIMELAKYSCIFTCMLFLLHIFIFLPSNFMSSAFQEVACIRLLRIRYLSEV